MKRRVSDALKDDWAIQHCEIIDGQLVGVCDHLERTYYTGLAMRTTRLIEYGGITGGGTLPVVEDEGQLVAELLAAKGREWSLRALRPVDQAIYLYRLMPELARLQDPDRLAS